MPSTSAVRRRVHPLSATILRITRAKSAFANRSAASGSPRSSKTLPVLGSTSIDSAIFNVVYDAC